jgi:glycosyltransferase involved in cell wall biosynthesis
MKVVHISFSDTRGGAGRAAYRIHTSLKKNGVDSRMLVFSKYGNDLDVTQFNAGRGQNFLHKLRRHYEKFQINKYKNRKRGTFSIANYGANISYLELIREADILNLHWINKNFLSLKSIKQISKINKSIVWRLPDMWAFTGGCHCSDTCKKYEEICGQCPFLGSSKVRDLSYEILSRKSRVFKDLNLTIVTPSNWLAHCVKNSTLFKNNKIEVIPNPVNTEIFKPIEKGKAREILNLPDNKFLFLFAISPGANIEGKGINYLTESLLIINKKFPALKEKIELLVLGIPYSEKIKKIPFNIRFLGTIYDDFAISLYYNAADLLISPSLQEAFGLTFIEAMSCATPCIAFNYSGPVDIIEHKKNGFLAKYKSAEDIAAGISWLLEDKKRLIFLAKNAREKVLKNYSYDIIGNKYLKLYESLTK